MATDPCEGCDRRVPIAGGIANLWSFDSDHTGGVTLELADGTEHFLCFECVDELPDEPTAADVERLPIGSREEPSADASDGESGMRYLAPAVAVGAGVGAAVGVSTGDLESWLATGAAAGVGLGLLLSRIVQGRA